MKFSVSNVMIGIAFILIIQLLTSIDLIFALKQRNATPMVEDIPAVALSRDDLQNHLEVVGLRTSWSPSRWVAQGPFLDKQCHLYWFWEWPEHYGTRRSASAMLVSVDLSTVNLVRRDRAVSSRTELVLGDFTHRTYLNTHLIREKAYYAPSVTVDQLLDHRTQIAEAFGTHSFQVIAGHDGSFHGTKHGTAFLFSEPRLDVYNPAEMEASLETLVGHCRAHQTLDVAASSL